MVLCWLPVLLLLSSPQAGGHQTHGFYQTPSKKFVTTKVGAATLC
jgi:hypothetical protein